jgi:hypothetical protein
VTIDLSELTKHLNTSEVGVHLPPGALRDGVAAACREAGANVVEIETLPEVIVTADGIVADGTIRPLKEEVDAIARLAQTVIVLRLLGDVPLAPTMDAYLDVEMIPGRDVWLDDLSSSVRQ